MVDVLFIPHIKGVVKWAASRSTEGNLGRFLELLTADAAVHSQRRKLV